MLRFHRSPSGSWGWRVLGASAEMLGVRHHSCARHLLKCLVSPGKRAVRINPGCLVSDRLCRVRERWLFVNIHLYKKHKSPCLSCLVRIHWFWPLLQYFTENKANFPVWLAERSYFRDVYYMGRSSKIQHLRISLKSCLVGCQRSPPGESTQRSLLLSTLSVESPYSFQDVFWGI